jgi:cytoplasmic iron level regulating protein YaaA (DUF328/UPF0246 family)
VLVLLPPSETKRDGGTPGSRLDLASLSFPELRPQRRAALAELRALSRNVSLARQALKLGDTQRFEIDRNRAISTSPTMPAIDRYTGVLYDGLDAASLSADARRFVLQNVAIHSALFGLTLGGEPIPAYRLSHDSRLQKTRMKSLWSEPVARVLASRPGLLLDLRSEAYVELGEAPQRTDSVFVRVVTESAEGKRRALNHFNKRGKGEFLRALAEHGDAGIDSVDALLRWAAGRGIRLVAGASGELDLVVDGVVGAPLVRG